MLTTEKGVKRKEKESTVTTKSLTTVPHKDKMSAANSSAQACSAAPAAASSVTDHEYDRQSPELTPLPESDPNTPGKPAEKKLKGELTLSQLQNNIAGLINERADSLESLVTRNTVSIDALKKSIDFVFTEVETLKADMKVVNRTCENNNQKLSEVEMRINEAEWYQRRWNLRLHGIPENKQENIKARVADICCAVAGENQAKIKEDIDIAHRLGRFNDKQKMPRTTIIRFTNRSSRDLVWRMAKNSSFLKENRLRFTEDLTTADKALREKLWPIIEAAKKEGKKAHFAGVRVIIEGKEMHPTLSPRGIHSTPDQMDTARPP